MLAVYLPMQILPIVGGSATGSAVDETHPEECLLTGSPRWLRGHGYGAMPPARSKSMNPEGPEADEVRGKHPLLLLLRVGEVVLNIPENRNIKPKRFQDTKNISNY